MLVPSRRRLRIEVWIVLGLSLGLAFLSRGGDYLPLATGLAADDSGAITTKLKSLGVPYKLEAGGATILVPAAKFAQARVDLAAEKYHDQKKALEPSDLGGITPETLLKIERELHLR